VNLSLFWLQLFSTWVMVGIIWLVQFVHYPLMQWGDRDRFGEMSRLNQAWTSWVVGGPMLIEAGSAVWLLMCDDGLFRSPEYWTTVWLLLVIWSSTVFRLMPLHRRLLQGFDAAAIEGLVRRNWVRTVAWSARAVMLSWIGWSQGFASQTFR
jgi:hypothetical protein